MILRRWWDLITCEMLDEGSRESDEAGSREGSAGGGCGVELIPCLAEVVVVVVHHVGHSVPASKLRRRYVW